ncbi:MAG: hypothetical protein KIS66_07280 [Fimbriimonadaceae bacterium]|nr:hypothetical protein [Fimbriimonadaceae bacterium]
MSVPRPGWIRRNVETYVGNAVAVRDYRAQLRGFRAPILWGVYLAVMILLAVLNYTNIETGREISVTRAQGQLQGFYYTMMGFLGTTVVLVAPGLTATAVVSERIRRSLDLVFSSPVEPKYFLVGKIVASYRYSWMLLVLSLPITATCVVLGGATWQDVIVGYILLSLIGLILTSVSLLISATAAKVVSAVIQSYAIAVLYFIGTAVFASTGAMAFVPGGGSREAPFTVCLNPAAVAFVPGTYTVIAGTNVPNWIIVLVLALAFTKLCVLSAAATLSPLDSGETRSLRLHGLLYMAILAMFGSMVGQGLSGFAGMIGATPAAASSVGDAVSLALGWCALFLSLFVAHLACYGPDQGRRYQDDGWFSWRGVWRGSPSGALPYLAMLWGALVLAFWAWMAVLALPLPDAGFAAYAAWSLGLLLAYWGLARLASRLAVTVGSARLMWSAAVVLLTFLPPVVISTMTYDPPSAVGHSMWKLYPLWPLLAGPQPDTWIAAIELAVFGIVFAVAACWIPRRGSRVPPRVANHG